MTPKARALYDALIHEGYLEVKTSRDFGEPDDIQQRLIWLTGKQTDMKEYFPYHYPDSAIAQDDGTIKLDLFKPQTYREWVAWNDRIPSEGYSKRFFSGTVANIEEAIRMIRRCYSGISGEKLCDADGQLKLF